MHKKVYKIARPVDGLFSDGSCPPRFTDGGYVWGRRAEALEHIATVSACAARWPYEGCELISYGTERRASSALRRPK